MLLKLYITIMISCFSALANAKQSNLQFQTPQSLMQTVQVDTTAKSYDWRNLKHYSHQNYRQFRGSHRRFYKGSRSIFKNDLRIYNGRQRLNNIGTRLRGNIYINPRKIYRNKYRFNSFPNKHYNDATIVNRPYNRFHHVED